ncbi:peptide ABC transporter substrate-binding protein [Chloroflexota bacterium]
MKNLRWQILIVVVALVAIGVLLLIQKPSVLPGIEQVLEPTSGGVYTEALVGSLGRLNPVLDDYNSADQDVNRLLFSSLIRFDNRGLPESDLAESWGISQNGEIYNISIQEEAIWHDGKPVTSDDIIFTVDLMREEEMPIPPDLQEFWTRVEVEALDEKTLQFKLPEPFAPFMDYLTFGIVPKHLLDGLSVDQFVNSPYNLEPVGSGPYKFSDLKVENGEIAGVVLNAFEDYYDEKPFIEQVVFQYYPDASTALTAYQNEEVMGISQVSPDVLSDALKEPGLKVYTGRMSRLNLVYLNLDDSSLPFFQEPAVRQALMMGVNRRWIVDRILGGQAIIAHGPIFPENWAYYEGIERVGFDREGAISILKDAGYTIPAEGGGVRAKDGTLLEFEMLYPDIDPYPAMAESIKADWAQLGVGIALKSVPYEELVNDYLDKRNYEAALVELNFDISPDPDPYPFWHQAQITGGQNYSGWNDRQASEYLETARIQVDQAERMKRYRNFQVRFGSELPALPLLFPVYTYGIDAQVQGVSMGPIFTPSDRFDTIASWFLNAAPAESLSKTPTIIP